MHRRRGKDDAYHQELRLSVNELSEDKSSLDFHPKLLKAWLTLRFNPSANSFFTGRGPKNNPSRKLSAEELGVGKFEGSAEKAAGELQSILFDIVRSTTASIPKGERIGVLSSGGIDSTTVIAILRKLGYCPEAYSIGFGAENDEIDAARMAAESLGITHHARVLNKILASTVDANRSLDEPYRAACYYYDALKFAKESGVRYVFDGLGVDEFFGGYGFRYEQVMRLQNSGMSRLDAYVQGAHPSDYVASRSDLFGEKLRHIEIDWNALLPYFDNGLTFLDQMFLADYDAKCRQNFAPLAGFAQSLGIDVFYPWVDDRLIDFSLRIPAEWKYEPETGRTKMLFRAAVRDLVPKSTMDKKKQGFGPGLGRVYEELKPLAENTVLDGYMVSNGYVNGPYYRKVLEKKAPSPIEINKLWDVYTLEVFLDELRHGVR